MKPTIYIAGSYSAKEYLAGQAERLAVVGYSVISTWLRSAGEMAWDEASRERRRAIAEGDLNELSVANLVIVDATVPSTGGGYHFEAGVAHGQSIELWLVADGPVSGFLEYAANRIFPDWDAAMTALRQVYAEENKPW